MSIAPTIDQVLDLPIGRLAPLRQPVMVVALKGLFDIGGVATGALLGFAPEADAVTIGAIDPDPFFDFTQERPTLRRAGNDTQIEWPASEIRLVGGHGDRDLVTLIGTEPHLHWRSYTDTVAAAARRTGCGAVVTLGAAAEPVPHTRSLRVTGSTSNPDLARALGVGPPSYQGPTGVAGVLQARLATEFPAVSLRVSVPHYLVGTSHHRATHELQQHLGRVLGLEPPHLDPISAGLLDEEAESHDAITAADPQLAAYVRMLEVQYDQRIERQVQPADDLAAEFQAFLDGYDPPSSD